MVEPTAGSIVYKDSINVLNQMNTFRKELGLCPQENRLFPYLSVINHLIFFGMVRNFELKLALYNLKYKGSGKAVWEVVTNLRIDSYTN